jgi:hypothetical protein
MKLTALALFTLLAVTHATPVRIETGTETRSLKIDLAAEVTACLVGNHIIDGKCVSNKDYCSEYDAVTHNCASCNWYAFWVENDPSDASGSKTGNYCVTRWWVWILSSIAFLLFFGILIGLCVMWAGKKRPAVVEEERKPINKPKPVQEVEVHAERPSYRQQVVTHYHQEPAREVHYHQEPAREVHYHQEPVREVHGDSKIIRHDDRTVVNERREYLGVGNRVLIEERRSSPGKEINVVKYDHEDWGKYSQAHWNDHQAGHMGTSTTKVAAHGGSYNPYASHH